MLPIGNRQSKIGNPTSEQLSPLGLSLSRIFGWTLGVIGT
jgi:hypothetical protein